MADSWMELGLLIRAETAQRRQEGCDVTALEERLKGLRGHPGQAEQECRRDEMGV